MIEQSPFKRLLTLFDIFEMLAQTKDYNILNNGIVPSALLSKYKTRLQKYLLM
ncbi:hypothetical protein [Niabella ginsengisoli]|uniref:Uncharacterized protein n=1 Tax=Niabella ginsengisoli TaxID=522298 RepID=A0ABS9SEE4_9BACT|nr:hypothetical protein [Niabella ginsengisoli]MCH5596730.1 hypothetical protein [Niabella ginsengisoli]